MVCWLSCLTQTMLTLHSCGASCFWVCTMDWPRPYSCGAILVQGLHTCNGAPQRPLALLHELPEVAPRHVCNQDSSLAEHQAMAMQPPEQWHNMRVCANPVSALHAPLRAACNCACFEPTRELIAAYLLQHCSS